MGAESEGVDEIKSQLEKIIDGLPEAVRSAVDEGLREGMDHSVSIVHVITGRLRDSIRTENISQDGGDLVAGGTGGVDYAAHEELGTSRREGHPYLRPGMEVGFRSAQEKLKQKLDDLLR